MTMVQVIASLPTSLYFPKISDSSVFVFVFFLNPDSILPMFSSKNFIVSSLTIRSLIHVELTFVYGVKECFNFIFYS